MTDQINLTQLREKATTGDNLHSRSVVLALIDTAEAAMDVIGTWHAGVQPRKLQALEETLNHYTTT